MKIEIRKYTIREIDSVFIMDNDKVKIKNEVNIIDEVEIKEESIDDFITINNITHDSPVRNYMCYKLY